MLGLCPLLAVSTTVVTALGLGLVTLATLAIAAVLVSAARRWVPDAVRLPAFVVIIATAVSAADLLLAAYLPALHGRLGLFVPLIVTNCIILGRAEAFASRQPVRRALADGVAMGLGFAGALVVLGGLRELAASGCLLAGAEMLLPLAPGALEICLGPSPGGWLLAALPPGAFLGLAALVAARNALSRPRPGARR